MKIKNLSNLTSTELEIKLNNNDNDAWLYIRNLAFKKAYSMLFNSLGIKEPENEAEDIAQDVMLKYNTEYKNKKIINHPKVLVLKMGKNNVLNRLRHIDISINKPPNEPEQKNIDYNIEQKQLCKIEIKS